MKKLLLALLVLLGLQTKAQISFCDSIAYTTTSTINYPFIVTGIANIPGTVTWNWTVCNSNLCYSSSGVNASFGQVSLTDTLKVCYDVLIDISTNKEAQSKYKIAVTPTIVIFKDGEEVARFKADLSFKMIATREEVQEEIDNQLMSDF